MPKIKNAVGGIYEGKKKKKILGRAKYDTEIGKLNRDTYLETKAQADFNRPAIKKRYKGEFKNERFNRKGINERIKEGTEPIIYRYKKYEGSESDGAEWNEKAEKKAGRFPSSTYPNVVAGKYEKLKKDDPKAAKRFQYHQKNLRNTEDAMAALKAKRAKESKREYSPKEKESMRKAQKSVSSKEKELKAGFRKAMGMIIKEAHAPDDVPRRGKTKKAKIQSKAKRPQMEERTVKGGKSESGLPIADVTYKQKPVERMRGSGRTKKVIGKAKKSEAVRSQLKALKEQYKRNPTEVNRVKLRRKLDQYKSMIGR